MPVPRGQGGYVDLNQSPDAFRPKTTQHPGLIKRVLSAYSGGVLGSGEGSGNVAGEKREEGLPTPEGKSPGTAAGMEPSGWDQAKQAIQTVFPGTEPYFQLGSKLGDMLGSMNKQQQAASLDAGYAPSQPAQETMTWAQEYLKRQESL